MSLDKLDLAKSYIMDVETNGLLKTLDRVHCLVLRRISDGKIYRFRKNDQEDTIADGLKVMSKAHAIIGHNIIDFDLKAIVKVYPDWKTRARIIDTLVLVRMILPDVATSDALLVKKGNFPVKLVGSHSLDAWGIRMGKHKGDYAKIMLAAGRDPWALWNIEMEEYCVNDVEVNALLYAACLVDMPPDSAVIDEHAIHEICMVMRENGYPFDVAKAQALAQRLSAAIEDKIEQTKKRFGFWYSPTHKKLVRPIVGGSKKNIERPSTEWGEDYTRAVWGRMKFPKQTKWNKKIVNGKSKNTVPMCSPDSPFVPIRRLVFNPGSRQHVIDRFMTLYSWTPVVFTEKGNPKIDDSVLRTLTHIPEAQDVAEIFFTKKLLGYVETGSQSWLKNAYEGRVHPYTNVGGTITGRCSHAGPNIGQVPASKTKKINGQKVLLWGAEGDYGADCRSLFYVPDGWVQIGFDLKGLEFRCLAEEVADFDRGAMIKVVLNGDIHQYNADMCGIPDRETIKRVLYGFLYGAGDPKLGYIVKPLADEQSRKTEGTKLRNLLLKGVPALGKAIERVKVQAAKGYIIGLDGRKLKIRSEHAALNVRLQSNGALIAKRWVQFSDEQLSRKGLTHGWDGDYVFLAFVHDELQIAVRNDVDADLVISEVLSAATRAGKYYKFRCPIEADSKVGKNWAETH